MTTGTPDAFGAPDAREGRAVSAPDSPEILERFHSELALVEMIAAQIVRTIGRSVEFDDLVAAGREGLLNAARRFEPERGVPFGAYANFRVRGAIIDAVRRFSHLKRRAHERLTALEAAANVSEGEAAHVFANQNSPDAAAAGLALEQHLSSMALAAGIGAATEAHGEAVDGEDSPEDALAWAELVHLVRGAVSELDGPEKHIVRRHYLEGELLDDIARDLNMSKSWASRLHTRAIARLAKRLRNVAD